jgi:hypothetical protein
LYSEGITVDTVIANTVGKRNKEAALSCFFGYIAFFCRLIFFEKAL